MLNTGRAPKGYRLPADTHPGRVVLQIADLGRSLEYYQSVLGLSTMERTANRALLAPKNDPAVLIELREYPGARHSPRHGRIGLYHYAILLPTRADLGRFIAYTAEKRVRLGMADHLVSEATYLTDPDGLGIEVYADRPRENWRWTEGELAMASLPLDVQSLLDAAGGTQWNGLPAGTVIGHVHLHVGDLERGRAYYHDALGFDVVAENYPGALFLSAGGYHHHLGTNIWATGAPPAAKDEAHLVEWELIVPTHDDAAAAAEHLRQSGFPTEEDGRGYLARDPWGTAVRIAADRSVSA
jgi:catechol 2,3-dioxygenase